MQIKEYCESAKLTLADLKDLEMDNIHMVLGMLTETGELADVFKKNLAYHKNIDWINVQEEIGDTMWYIANFCNINGFSLEDILSNNIEKLRTRYPNKFTEYDANNRNLDAERSVLEKLENPQKS